MLKENTEYYDELNEAPYAISGKELSIIKGDEYVSNGELIKDIMIRIIIDLNNYLYLFLIGFFSIPFYFQNQTETTDFMIPVWLLNMASLAICLTFMCFLLWNVIGTIKIYKRKKHLIGIECTWILLEKEFIYQCDHDHCTTRFQYTNYNKCFTLFNTLIVTMDLPGFFLMIPMRMVNTNRSFQKILKTKIKNQKK